MTLVSYLLSHNLIYCVLIPCLVVRQKDVCIDVIVYLRNIYYDNNDRTPAIDMKICTKVMFKLPSDLYPSLWGKAIEICPNLPPFNFVQPVLK